jgi:hypothetical protein
MRFTSRRGNRMFLKKNRIEKGETITHIELEKIAHDCVMLSINFDHNDTSGIPSYWRLLGAKPNPPLEIGINTSQKTIKRMTFFVDANCFKELRVEGAVIINGNIIVDTDIFKKENDYVDTDEKYFVTISNNVLVCVFGTHNCIKERVGNERIRFFINHNDEVCGCEIHGLSEDELEMLSL